MTKELDEQIKELGGTYEEYLEQHRDGKHSIIAHNEYKARQKKLKALSQERWEIWQKAYPRTVSKIYRQLDLIRKQRKRQVVCK